MSSDRIARLLEDEQDEPEGWWWLSFADAKGFRGACMVLARGFLSAVFESKRLGINPGGQVRGVGPISEPLPGWTNRLLNQEECEAFNRIQSWKEVQ